MSNFCVLEMQCTFLCLHAMLYWMTARWRNLDVTFQLTILKSLLLVLCKSSHSWIWYHFHFVHCVTWCSHVFYVHIMVIRIVASHCSLVVECQHFRGMYCLYLHPWRWRQSFMWNIDTHLSKYSNVVSCARKLQGKYWPDEPQSLHIFYTVLGWLYDMMINEARKDQGIAMCNSTHHDRVSMCLYPKDVWGNGTPHILKLATKWSWVLSCMSLLLNIFCENK